MGARPVALLDLLRFGAPDGHFDRAVAGIGAYGNSVGVPTVGGEAVFDPDYAGNCLVNAMCVGLLPAERMTRAGATTPGNVLVLYGATTGRDGIGGASVLASQELGEGAAEKRPSVQIGDPFTGNRLIEVSLELVERGLVESLQDCGAAGLASSLAEMARDGAGVDVHLDRVPLREPGMEPWEIMISESQERMVAAVAPERLAEVVEVIERWELPHAFIGEVTDTGELVVYFGDGVVGSIPASFLTDDCPRYRLRQGAGAWGNVPPDPANLESKRRIFERYDYLVGSRTVRRPGLDAAVIRLSGLRGLAVSLDGPPPGERDPYRAGRLAVYGAAMNVACAGGEPIGLTDCLNFGNPEKPEIGWELAQAIEAIAEAAEELGIPVVSGNVSLYNETDGRAIPPTPTVGCVGLVRDITKIPSKWRRGDAILLLRGEGADLVHYVWQNADRFTLAHDVSWAGLEHCLAEAAAWSQLPPSQVTDCHLEGQGVVVAVGPGTKLDWPDVMELGRV
jgi:phosphoribosylformylglycinamidine synthase